MWANQCEANPVIHVKLIDVKLPNRCEANIYVKLIDVKLIDVKLIDVKLIDVKVIDAGCPAKFEKKSRRVGI